MPDAPMKSPAEIIAEVMYGTAAMQAFDGAFDTDSIASDVVKALAEAGYRIVPYDPEQANGMVGAGGVEMFKCDMAAVPPRDATIRIYRAMLDAAPDAGGSNVR